MTITVYITSYNQAQYLPAAIESVLGQTRRPDELLIVDDASSDESPQIIQQYQAQYPDLVRIVLKAQNSGVARARNTALYAARGDYIAYLDSDDRYLPTKLEREAAVLEGVSGGQAAFVFSDHYITDADGAHVARWAEDATPPTGDILPAVFMQSFPRGRMFRYELVPRQLLLEIGGYDPRMTLYEDDELRVRLAAVARAHYCADVLSTYRRHTTNISLAKAELHFRMLSNLYEKNRQHLRAYSASEQQAIIQQFDQMRRHYGKLAVQALLDQASLSLVDRWHLLQLVRQLRRLRPHQAYYRLLLQVITP